MEAESLFLPSAPGQPPLLGNEQEQQILGNKALLCM